MTTAKPQLHYIGIQGHNAPGYFLSEHRGQHFRSTIESITLKQALFISSRYRSDLLFYNTNTPQETIIKTWFTFLGRPFQPEVMSKFCRCDDQEKSLHYFFSTIGQLRQHSKYFEEFKESFMQVYNQESEHPIMKDIVQCDLHLAEHLQKKGIDYQPVCDEEAKALPVSYDTFVALAVHLASSYSQN